VDLKVKTERLDANKPADIARAAEILRGGGTVAFPTETVYGLGANALSSEAVAKIFEAKKRPGWDPLIVHVCDREMLGRVVDMTSVSKLIPQEPRLADPDAEEFFNVTRLATRLLTEMMDAFWPGPLTLLLPRTDVVPQAVTSGRPLVGVRIPKHRVALELIRLAGVPIAAPSANQFGHTSPTTAAHVLADLDGRIDAVLDGGTTDIGVESTVAGVSRDGVVVYRPGGISIPMIERMVGAGLVQVYRQPKESTGEPDSMPSPGVSLRHYAPKAKMTLIHGFREEERVRNRKPLELSLVDPIDRAFDGIEVVGVMLPEGWDSSCAQIVFPWGPWHQPDVLAQRLYAGLRRLDDEGATVIVCPMPEMSGIADAIRDRLAKAAK
jgi:L-threonylcarbamoyladenylate synthase